METKLKVRLIAPKLGYFIKRGDVGEVQSYFMTHDDDDSGDYAIAVVVFGSKIRTCPITWLEVVTDEQLKNIEQDYHCNGVCEPREATGVLKQLLNEHKSGWSEADEYCKERLLELTSSLKNYIHHDALISLDSRRQSIDELSKFENWFKSLKERYTWKPSEEQMDALETAISSLQSTTLESLYNELKKLREE